MAAQMPTTDDTLRKCVLQALAAEKQIAALGLRVGVLNGVVHLGGEATSAHLRDHAEAIAARVAGVRGVVNRIEAPGAPSPSRTINIPLDDRARDEP
jgi:osmotically-inducible protein OsmY